MRDQEGFSAFAVSANGAGVGAVAIKRASPASASGRRVTDPRTLANRALSDSCLSRLAGSSIVSVRDVTRAELLDLFAVAAKLQGREARAESSLAGKVVLTAFFEPSTRTRLSFESAAYRLGASVLSIADARFTAVHKGESLADSGVMLNAYADLVIMRHFAESSVRELRALGVDFPLINGGNGCDEHPTQAMADWYALLKWRPELALEQPPAESRISLCLIGVPRRMRSLRSFLLMGVTRFPRAIRDITVICDELNPLDRAMEEAIAAAGLPWKRTAQLERHVSGFDVIYQNSLTLVEQEYQLVGAKFRLDRQTPLKPSAVVMHPLARQNELSVDLDQTPHNLYFDQAEGAVFVRQALLLAVADRLQRMTYPRQSE
jgi:aspartate carbamoyltransferase catalytic subunit